MKRRADYVPLTLAGSCRSGSDNTGRIVHAVEGGHAWSALCGKQPRGRSAGWSSWPSEAVTCPKCLARLEELPGDPASDRALIARIMGEHHCRAVAAGEPPERATYRAIGWLASMIADYRRSDPAAPAPFEEAEAAIHRAGAELEAELEALINPHRPAAEPFTEPLSSILDLSTWEETAFTTPGPYPPTEEQVRQAIAAAQAGKPASE